MASRIDITTEELEQCARTAQQANQCISEAASLLRAIAVHNDWQCPQRVAIVSATEAVRKESEQLRADADSYYNQVQAAAAAFRDAENALNQKINGVNEIISKFISLVPQGDAGDSSASGGGGHSFSRSFAEQFKQTVSKKTGKTLPEFGKTINFASMRQALKPGIIGAVKK